MKSKFTKLELFLTSLWIIQALVNLIGALGPELGFDALWYHLTEAKLFLRAGNLNPIPGNLLYWSGLPRLAELIYALALKIGDERLPQLIHYFSGIISSYLVFRLARNKNPRLPSIVAALLFYTTLLVGWLSTSSYIDLIATLIFLIAMIAKRKSTQAVALALLGATKVTAAINFLAITLIPWPILGALPFLWVNYRSTGNPVYPFLEDFSFHSEYFFNGFTYWLSRPLRLFIDPSFRVGPIILLLIILFYRHINWKSYSKPLLITFLLWWFGPGTGFGRFSLIFLSLLSATVASLFKKNVSRLALFLVIIQAFTGITLRAWANSKYLPVITGQQTKQSFLTKNLKFNFGDFYDTDDWFKNNLLPTDRVLIYNIHNLYYVDFPYDHSTFASPNTHYTHILMGDDALLPDQYTNYHLVYHNPLTRVRVYQQNDQ